MITGYELIWTATAFLLGSVLQSAVGFGAGMFSIPLLVWAGISLPKAVGMMLGVITVHSAYNCYLIRNQIHWRPLIPMIALRSASMPLGVWIMERYLLNNRTQSKRAVGVVLLLSLLLTAKKRAPVPQRHAHWAWVWLAGIGSGVLAGSVGMGGPPLSLFALNQDWDSDQVRAFMWALFLLGAPMTVLFLFLRMGTPVLEDWLIGMAHIPFVWLGSQAGLKLTQAISRDTVRRISYAALFLMALLSIAAPGLAN